MRKLTSKCGLLATLIVLPVPSAMALFEPLLDGDGSWTGEVGLEYRYFRDPGEYGQTQNALALRFQPEYFSSWNEDQDELTFQPYLLIDTQDGERTHVDIRELLWVHVNDYWELRTGVTRVFWGRTELFHLVDVINQLDLVDGDNRKLGQPMVNLSLQHDWGLFDLYLLLGFRERPFPGEDGRLRTPLPVDNDDPVYSDDTGPKDIDFAARWQRPLTDNLEMALSVFSGVSREPSYTFNFDILNPALQPNYQHMDQWGLELEYILDSLVIKFEGIANRREFETYHATVLGFEYSFFSVLGSNIDLTWITEWINDSREGRTTGYLEQDLGFGARLAFNDEFDTSLLAGGFWDPDTKEKILSVEAGRRFGDQWRVDLRLVSVLERSEPDLGETNTQILNTLRQSPLFEESIDDYERLLTFLTDLVDREGLQRVFFDRDFGVETLQEIQRLATTDRKLNLVDSDDFIELNFQYFY